MFNKILKKYFDNLMQKMQNDSDISYDEWKEALEDYKEIFGEEYKRPSTDKGKNIIDEIV